MVHMPHWPKNIVTDPNKKDLSRMLNLLEALDNPHKKLPHTIHVAGTNGKGSSCAMLQYILQQAKYKVCMYTSPHILEFNERIILNGSKIDDMLLFHYLERVRIATEKFDINPTFFESITAAAFLAFSEANSHFLILETGMGGRLDPTNVVLYPILTLITTISYDHTEYLGDTIEKIAYEKAGIIKEKIPCVIGMQFPKAMEVLLEKCEKQNSPAICYEYDFVPEKLKQGFAFYSRLGNTNIKKFNMQGDHQIVNASAVLAACKLINNNFCKIPDQDIKYALEKVQWPGRIQKISLNGLFKDIKKHCWVDAAHNAKGAASLSHWLKEQNFKNITLIFGMTKNRDVYKFISQFQELNIKFYSAPVLSEFDSYSSERLAEIAGREGINVEVQNSLIEALEQAFLDKNNPEIIITGSIFLISDLFKIIRKL